MARFELLLPAPRRLTSLGGRIVLPSRPRVRLVGVEPACAAFSKLGRVFSRLGLVLELTAEVSDAVVEFALAEGLPAQGYRLLCDAGRVRIEASDEAGLFYGVCTLEQ